MIGFIGCFWTLWTRSADERLLQGAEHGVDRVADLPHEPTFVLQPFGFAPGPGARDVHARAQVGEAASERAQERVQALVVLLGGVSALQ